jgi:hypothetical protein
MLQWYRNTGSPNKHDLLIEGPGSGTYHEDIKNHHRNNIEQRYNGDVRVAIEWRLAQSEDNGASESREFHRRISAGSNEAEDLILPMVSL